MSDDELLEADPFVDQAPVVVGKATSLDASASPDYEIEEQHAVVVARIAPRRAPLATERIQVGSILEDSAGFQLQVIEVDRTAGTFLTEDLKVELPCLSVRRSFQLHASIMTFFNVTRGDDSSCEK